MQRFFCTVKLIVLLLFISSLSSQASEEKVGTSAASFLKIGIGARASGMGGASCALADDPTAIYWNPAGLAGIWSRQLTYGHNIWFKETTTGFLGFVHPFTDFSLGLGIDYLRMGEAEKTTELKPGGTGEKFRVEDDTAIFFSLSKKMKENLSLGMSIKHLSQKVADENANAYGADIGLLYRLPQLSLGLTIQNLGTEMKFADEKFPLPLNIKTGLAYKGIKNTILALDLNLPRDNKASYHLGGECRIGNVLALRAGYNSKIEEEGLSAGFGVKFKTIRLDMAYVHYGDLGSSCRISLLSRFGGQDIEDRRPARAGIPKADVREQKAEGREQRAEGREQKAEEVILPLALEVSDDGDTTGLNLIDGKSYYVNVRTSNKAELWSETGTSDGITVAKAPVVIEEEITVPGVTPSLPIEPMTSPLPPTPSEEVPKPETPINQSPLTNHHSPISMTAQVYEEPEYVKLYIHLKNTGDREIYTTLSDFTLLTEDSRTFRPDISWTYTTENHFLSGSLGSNSEKKGFLIFDAKEIPKSLTYEDLSGNKVSVLLP
ncbi:PorV/PorQ family protein [bacterium]|nr:PorV/PorQ family protein [bacterium]